MELFAGVMQTRRPACALVLRKTFFSVAAKTVELIKYSFAFSSQTIETGWCSVKPENLKQRLSQTATYQLCMVPSSLRLIGKYARRYAALCGRRAGSWGKTECL